MDVYKKLLRLRAKKSDINRYGEIRLRLERGLWSCDQELAKLQSEMQDLANELGLS